MIEFRGKTALRVLFFVGNFTLLSEAWVLSELEPMPER